MATFLKLPSEILLQIFELLPLNDLLAIYRVDHRCRLLVPRIRNHLRRRLLKLALEDITTYSALGEENTTPIRLSDRISYVEKVEKDHNIRIPEQYRTILTEWPSSRPLPGSHWPHDVQFHAIGYCTCAQETCGCQSYRFYNANLVVTPELLFKLRRGGTLTDDDSINRRIFGSVMRIESEEQMARTIKFILSFPHSRWTVDVTPSHIFVEVPSLRLSRYNVVIEDGSTAIADFFMVVGGPGQGEIYGWQDDVWYDGFEAESFLDWKYEKNFRDRMTMEADA